jgi:hypothetical protein
MPNPSKADDDTTGGERLGWRGLAFILALHALGVSVATYPSVLSLGSDLPGGSDDLQHLWVMQWYKTCLFEGRWPLLCPEIQHPVGAPLGNFSPLHLQASLYLPLSLLSGNDILCYNLVWLIGLLLTGLGTSLLAWRVVGDRACAAFAGLLAVLSEPVMAHSHGHTELIYVGTFPLFLLAWMGFVDRPGRGRLAAAVGGYLLVAMSAAYFLVFAVVPAALYVAWSAARGGWRGVGPWAKRRAGWLAAFGGLSLAGLAVLFYPQIWAIRHGFQLPRSRAEFELFGAMPWSYVVPPGNHYLNRLLPSDPYRSVGPTREERTGYLGVVTVLLLAYAAARRIRVPRGSYLWSALGLVVVLSFGAAWTVGAYRVSLPSGWLWHYFPPYRLTRCPSRFSLFAGVLAGVLAAAGLRHLLARLPNRGARAAAFAVVTALAVGDLSPCVYWRQKTPQMPGCYAFLKAHDPDAAILEVPFGDQYLNAVATYWQARHRLTTASGYSGHANAIQMSLMALSCPFSYGLLVDDSFLDHLDRVSIDVALSVDYKAYVWLYLHAFRFDYVVLHKWERLPLRKVNPRSVSGLTRLFAEARVYEDDRSVVFARARMAPAAAPVVVPLGGFLARDAWKGRWNGVTGRQWNLAAFLPAGAPPVALAADAAPLRRAGSVRLREGAVELARWAVEPGDYRTLASPLFGLPAGLHVLTFESVRDPSDPDDRRAAGGDGLVPNPLRVSGVCVRPVPAPVADRDRRAAGATLR